MGQWRHPFEQGSVQYLLRKEHSSTVVGAGLAFTFGSLKSPQRTSMSQIRSSNRSIPESQSAFEAPLNRPRWHALIVPLCVLGPLLGFGLLAEDVFSRETIRFDDPLLLRFHAHANPFFNAVMLAFSRLGGLPILGYSIFGIALLLWRKQRARAIFLLSAMVGTCLLNVALKAAFQRTRPDLWLSIAPEHDSSFPSGHSMLSSTFVLAVLPLTWSSRASLAVKGAATAAGLGFVVGVISSRLYLGVHYPSDVLAGFCVSLSWVSLLTGISRRRLRRPLS
jgi:membrane-associated phospholipid phosphatase